MAQTVLIALCVVLAVALTALAILHHFVMRRVRWLLIMLADGEPVTIPTERGDVRILPMRVQITDAAAEAEKS